MRLLPLAVLVLAASGCTGIPVSCDAPRHEIVVQNPYGWTRHECVLDPPPSTPAPTPTHPTVWV